MALTPSEAASLARSLGRWEFTEYIAEAFVVIGCVGELIADLATCLTEHLKKRIERWSTILLIAALIVSLVSLQRTNELSGEIIGALGDVAGNAAKNATDALADSGTAVKRAGAAKELAEAAGTAADKAQDKVDAVSRQAATLEKEVGTTKANLLLQGPRVKLLAPKNHEFSKALKPFPGQKIILLTKSVVPPETQELLGILEFDFFDEKWSVSLDKSLDVTTSVLILSISKGAPKRTREAATALALALQNVGLIDRTRSRLVETDDAPTYPDDCIQLIVGEHL